MIYKAGTSASKLHPWTDRMEIKPNKNSSLFYGGGTIAAAIINGLLVYGARYSFSIFFPEILDEFGWSRGSTALMMSINVLVYGLMAPVTGTLGGRWKPRIMMTVGAAIIALAMVGCSLAYQLWHFYVFFGVFVPVGTALCGWPVLMPAIMNWFATRRGLVMGIGQMGGGLSFVYGLVAQYLILHFGWRSAYVGLAMILISVLLPLNVFIFHYRPESKGLKAYGSEELKFENAGQSGVPLRDWTLSQMLRTYQLWLLVLSHFFSGASRAFWFWRTKLNMPKMPGIALYLPYPHSPSTG
ncbi:MAG: MFS transporter [Deltaproteobacteria bacterium]|nr:MFS transporter [Deltaproteobacteria bacterium]